MAHILLTRTEYGNRIPLEVRLQFRDLLSDSYYVPSLTHYLR
jgi:anaphase-promoting complex subunit 5